MLFFFLAGVGWGCVFDYGLRCFYMVYLKANHESKCSFFLLPFYTYLTFDFYIESGQFLASCLAECKW